MRTSYISLVFAIALIGITISASGCDNLAPKSDSLVKNGTTAQISGQVVFRDKDGGFYGILTDNGAQLEPINLDARFKTDGARVTVQGKLDSSRLGVHGWGNPVEIFDAQPSVQN
jgi:hypothetical protein